MYQLDLVEQVLAASVAILRIVALIALVALVALFADSEPDSGPLPGAKSVK